MDPTAVMIFRRHRPQDFEQIATLRWHLKTEGLPLETLPDQRDFTKSYLAQLRDQQKLEQTIHWVLETAAGVEGVMTVRLVAKETSLSGQNRRWGYLTNVYIADVHRNNGHGSALLQKVITWAKKSEIEFLLVWPSDRSITFYRRVGFEGSGDPLTLNLV